MVAARSKRRLAILFDVWARLFRICSTMIFASKKDSTVTFDMGTATRFGTTPTFLTRVCAW